MVLFLVAVVLLIVYQMKIQNSMDYLNHNNTLAINGIFVLLVFLSHCYSSLNITPTLLDESYKIVQWHMDQAIVIPFLFFSGYGIALSLKNKPNYIWSLLKVRLPKLLIHFDIAVVIYLIIQLVLGTTYPIKHILLYFCKCIISCIITFFYFFSKDCFSCLNFMIFCAKMAL